MRTKLNGLLTLFLALIVQITFAQEKTVSGMVTDQDGLPLPGVNIVVEGTTNGTQTDFDGNYAITAASGQTLLFTYIGQKNERQQVGAGNTINVQMSEDAQALEEVVVTAQGIKREKKALGYAVTSVGAEQLQDRAEGDVARVLSGKAAGVNITAAGGAAGSATNVVIRGLNSFSGNNQALFIVDGVPFANDTNQQGDFIAGNTGGSRFLDLDPNNIANIEVLKGLSAATLYGTQGRNGVILITTKAGSTTTGPKKTEITISQSYFANEIASTPDYQDDYGNGFDQAFGWFFSNWGPSFQEGGTAGWASTERNRCERYVSAPLLYCFFCYLVFHKRFQNLLVHVTIGNLTIPLKNSLDLEIHLTQISIFQGHRMTVTPLLMPTLVILNDEGFTPGNSFDRLNVSLGGVAKLSNKIHDPWYYELRKIKRFHPSCCRK